MKPRIDANNKHLKQVLDQLFQADETISVRAVARAHPSLNNASAFTRDPLRMALIAEYQSRQQEVRTIGGKLSKRADEKLSSEVATARVRIEELEGDVRALVASHVGMIGAVLRAGGMSALEQFWNDYSAISERLNKLQAMPSTAQVLPLSSPR